MVNKISAISLFLLLGNAFSHKTCSPAAPALAYENSPLVNTSIFLNDPAFLATVEASLSSSCDVVLTIATAGFMSMLINFLESVTHHGVEVVFVVALTPGVCENLPRSATCYQIPHVFSKTMSFGSNQFIEMSHVKFEVALATLQLGYGVLLIDTDIIFLQNPMPELRHRSAQIDVQIQQECTTICRDSNSGFMYFAPRQPAGLVLYESIIYGKTHFRQDPRTKLDVPLSDQVALNIVLPDMRNKTVSIYMLDPDTYANGARFFWLGKRAFVFDNPCSDCMIAHNNFIFGERVKQFRFKEQLQWFVDTNGYFSSTTAKYLEYGFELGNVTSEAEAAALKTAFKLGEALGRIVILPRFSCPGYLSTGCAFHYSFRVTDFDKEFEGTYREHVFRYSHLVPVSIRKGLQQNWTFTDPSYCFREEDCNGSSAIHLRTDPAGVVMFPDVAAALSSPAPVISFASLASVTVRLPVAQDEAFEAKWLRALQKTRSTVMFGPI